MARPDLEDMIIEDMVGRLAADNMPKPTKKLLLGPSPTSLMAKISRRMREEWERDQLEEERQLRTRIAGEFEWHLRG